MGQVRNFRLNESGIGPYPTTDVLPLDNIKLGILAYQGPTPAEDRIVRSSQTLRHDRIETSSVIVLQYIVAVVDKQSEEVWACHMTPNENSIDVNGGTYRIEASVFPTRNTVITQSLQGFSGLECPSHAAKITFCLPLTRQATQPKYDIFFTLYHQTERGATICASLYETVFPSVSRPVEKIRVTGALITNFGRKWANLFRNLVDKGGYTKIGQYRKVLESIVNKNGLPQQQDVVCLALLEESDAYLTQGTMKDAKDAAQKACSLIEKYNSVNAPILRGYAYVVFAVAARVEGKFEEAEIHLERACQEMEPIEACEFKCYAPYNIGTLVMDKLAVGGISDEDERQRGRRAFQDAVRYCTGQYESHMLPRVLNRVVSFLLRSTPNRAPDTSLTVPAEDIEEAGETLMSLQIDVLPWYPLANWAKALFYLNKSDYYMRRGFVHAAYAFTIPAIEDAKTFKNMATEIGGLSTKRRAAEERIQNLRILQRFEVFPAL